MDALLVVFFCCVYLLVCVLESFFSCCYIFLCDYEYTSSGQVLVKYAFSSTCHLAKEMSR